MAAESGYMKISGEGEEFYREIQRPEFAAHRVKRQQLLREQRNMREEADMREEALHRTRQNDVHQLLGMFAVFQGVIFTGVAQSTTLGCADALTPVLLCAASAVSTLAALLHKIAHARALSRAVRKSKERAEAYAALLEDMKLHLHRFDLSRDPRTLDSRPEPRADAALDCLRHLLASSDWWPLTLIPLISGTVIAFCRLLLCSPACVCLPKP